MGSEFEPEWSETPGVSARLTCKHGTEPVGFVDIGLKQVDGDPAVLLIDMIQVDAAPGYRSGRVANWLIDSVVDRWPNLALRGGPLSQDDPPGPSFRLRTWRRGVEFHDGQCELVRR